MVSVVLLLIALQGLGEFCVISFSSRSCQFLVELGVLVCPVGGILTHPGTLCPGTTTTLSCSTTGTLQQWGYENEFITSVTSTSSSVEHTVSGVDFTVSVLSTSPELVSQILFVASVTMNGTTLQCSEESVTLLVDEVGGKKYILSSLKIIIIVYVQYVVHEFSGKMAFCYVLQVHQVMCEWAGPHMVLVSPLSPWSGPHPQVEGL